MSEYKGHEIRISEAKRCPKGRVRWYRAIYIDGKYVCDNQHKARGEAIYYAQRIIEAREAAKNE